MIRSLGWKTVLATLVVASTSAMAANFDSKERAAQKACMTGAPSKGVELLTDLYLDTYDVTYIYNQGRCLEMNRRYDDAIVRFREYLVKGKDLTADEKQDAEKHIRDCEAYLGKSGPEPAKAVAPVKPEAITGTPVTTERPREATAVAPSVEPRPAVLAPAMPNAHTGAGLRSAGIATAAAGAGALAAAVILNVKANSMTADLEKPYNYDPGRDGTRQDYKTIGWIGYGVGAGCLVGGALLYYIGWRQGSHTSVVPSVAPGMAGATFRGMFR